MKSTNGKLLTILLAGLVLRLLLLGLVSNPGLHDPLHYTNLGRRLAQGQGFTVDYIWHYSRMPQAVIHPIDHWMPLAGVAAGAGIKLFGEGATAGLLVFVLAGGLLPLIAFQAARNMRLSDAASLLAAAFAAFLPDLVYASLRADTTALNALLIGGAVLLLQSGLNDGRRDRLLLAGVAAGLAYLTRNDSLLFLPLAGCVVVYRWRIGDSVAGARQAIALIGVGFLLAATPWLLRNLHELNMLGSAETGRMFFMVEHHDHYAWRTPITLETMLQRRSLGELLFKRGFEWLAAIKQIIVSFGIPLFLMSLLGLGTLLYRRERERMAQVSPALLWTLGILIAYPLLLPLKSQAGSFEKAFLSILPLLLPLAALGIERSLRNRLLQRAVVIAILAWLIHDAWVLTRQETAKADLFYGSMDLLIDVFEELPDFTGDGKLRFMTQDPYVLSHFGYESIMMPLSSREDTLELARRYAIDYLILPAGRPSLDALYQGRERDDRFVLAAHLPESGEEPFELYRFVFD